MPCTELATADTRQRKRANAMSERAASLRGPAFTGPISSRVGSTSVGLPK